MTAPDFQADPPLMPDTAEAFFSEGPRPAQRNFLAACSGPIEGFIFVIDTYTQALDYARTLGHAALHFMPDGWIHVWPVTQEPDLAELQTLVDGYIEPVTTPKLGSVFNGGYVAYANDNGLGSYPPNAVFPQVTGCEPFDGPAVLLSGFRLDEHGTVVPYVPPVWPPMP